MVGATIETALKATLDHHEPYPAMVLDGRWNLVMANTGARSGTIFSSGGGIQGRGSNS